MFIISVDGGLGNQMFQYAFFLSMKEHYFNSKVYLDTSLLKKNVHNGYELERVFGIQEPMADKMDVMKYSEYCPVTVKHSHWINRLNQIRRCIYGIKASYIVQEDSTAYYDEYYHLSALTSYYLRGVWANSQYFSNVKKLVYKKFVFPDIHDEKNKKWMWQIQNCNSVGIHYRRGDYVQFGFEVLGEDYYSGAIKCMEKMVSAPRYFVFSDDVAYAKKIFGEKSSIVYVEGNEKENAYMDMVLMSLCKHNIIGNSTFSFWGAYLNQNINKCVIYPNRPVEGCKFPYAEQEWIGI